jgi:oligopeptide transport system substrate-binding protein
VRAPFALAALAALAVACGGGAVEPRPGRLRLNLGTEPPTLDWTRATDSVSVLVIEQLMRGLARLDASLRPEPALAERWEVSPDGLVWTFHLRRGVRWTDGEPLVAQQFVDAWLRLLAPATGAEYAYFLFPVAGARAYNAGENRDPASVGVRAPSDDVLEVRLEAPLVYFPSLTTFMVTFPVRLDLIERFGERWTEPEHLQTLGPFRLAEWRHEYRIRLAANADYFAGPPRLEEIVGYMVGEPSTALVLFEQGLLDVARPPPLEIARYRSHPRYRHVPALRGYYYGFNTRLAPFDDARVRRAFSMAIDREAFPALLRGQEVPQSAWIPPGMPHHSASIGLRFDPEGARALLARAGVDPAALAPIRVVYNSDPTHRMVAEKVQEQWQRHLGVRVELRNREWKVFLRELAVDPPPVFRLGWGADFPDPDNFMSLFTSYSDNNHTGWADAEYDAVVERAARERDPSRRQALYDRAQRILCEEAAPIAPLFVTAIHWVVAERIRGLEPNAMDLLMLDGVSAR